MTALAAWAPRRGVAVRAAHLDHRRDAGSAGRARRAARIAAALGVPCSVQRRDAEADSESGSGASRGWEADARRARYAFLEAQRAQTGARYTVTAHHRDDQAETVALRLLAGSGIAGLAAIRPAAPRAPGRAGFSDLDRVVRPLLEVPQAELHRALADCPLAPNHDPTNDDLDRPRNRVRRRVLPALAGRVPGLPARLAALAAAAGGAAAAIDRALDAALRPEPLADEPLADEPLADEPVADGPLADGPLADGIEARVALADLGRLPAPLLPAALALLHRRAGARYPPPAGAREELASQLERRLSGGGSIGCDGGDGWRWESRGQDLCVVAARRRAIPAPFTYTLEVPGALEMPGLSLRFRLRRAPLQPWMLRGEPRRAGLALPLAPGEVVTVRSRRPGDRLQPLGAPGRRRLKQVLIDRRVPRPERDWLPLLCLGRHGERIAWVPGVTVDESFRLDPAQRSPVWLAELEPLADSSRRETPR